MPRTPGPQKAFAAQCSIDDGTLVRQSSAPPGPTREADLSSDDLDLFMDLTQLLLDLVGIVDPTPVSDSTNAAISIGRNDWVGAGLSAVSMVPYVGDLAKAGKLGRWASTIHRAVERSRTSVRFAERARPVFSRLAAVLDAAAKHVPPSLRAQFNALAKELDDAMGSAGRVLALRRVRRVADRLRGLVDDPTGVIDRMIGLAHKAPQSVEKMLVGIEKQVGNFRGRANLRITNGPENWERQFDTWTNPATGRQVVETPSYARGAKDHGRYLGKPGSTRDGLAVMKNWNSMTEVESVLVPKNTIVLDGVASLQSASGAARNLEVRPGGDRQIFLVGRILDDGTLSETVTREFVDGSSKIWGQSKMSH